MKEKTAIIFPGQGSQAIGMGKDLAENFKIAHQTFEQVDEILGVKLSDIMFHGPADQLTKTQHTQPALMAVSIALVRILEHEFNLKFNDLCNYSAGHSLGEYSALCASNAIDLEQTTKLLQIRSNAMAKCGEKNPGAMAAILGSEINIINQIVNQAKQQEICQVANDNSIGQVVISGSLNAVNRAIEIAKAQGIKKAIMLPVSGAFHSELMNNAKEEMKLALSNVKFSQPSVSIIANVTADLITNHQQIPDLLVNQITASVRWRETILKLEALGVERVIEIGSGKVLSGLVSRTSDKIKTINITNCQDLKVFVENN